MGHVATNLLLCHYRSLCRLSGTLLPRPKSIGFDHLGKRLLPIYIQNTTTTKIPLEMKIKFRSRRKVQIREIFFVHWSSPSFSCAAPSHRYDHWYWPCRGVNCRWLGVKDPCEAEIILNKDEQTLKKFAKFQ